MLTTPVQSSNIARVAWAEAMLYVQFHHGGVYSYQGVPERVYHDLVAAPSVGKFFAAKVKPKFAAARVAGEMVAALGFTERIGA